MAFDWRADDGLARLQWYLDPPTPHQLKRRRKKRCQSWTPSDTIFWIRVCDNCFKTLLPVVIVVILPGSIQLNRAAFKGGWKDGYTNFIGSSAAIKLGVKLHICLL